MDEEIKKFEEDFTLKEKKITNEVNSLMVKINCYTNIAWIFVIIGFLIVGYSIFYFFKYDKLELNELGDFLSGSVASAWSLAGLFLIYVAFLGQKQQLLNQQLEISYSQLELKYTRNELVEQRKEMTLQNDTLKIQKFENTFFQMLNLFHSIVNSMAFKDERGYNNNGRECFISFTIEFNIKVRNYINNYGDRNLNRSVLKEDHVIEIYDLFYLSYRNYLSHYFRTYYHIIKLIDNTEDIDKSRYISIARAQLSSSEQILLFYNCLHGNGREKFKPLIEKYTLFNNIDSNLLVNDQILNSYSINAYEKEK